MLIDFGYATREAALASYAGTAHYAAPEVHRSLDDVVPVAELAAEVARLEVKSGGESEVRSGGESEVRSGGESEGKGQRASEGSSGEMSQGASGSKCEGESEEWSTDTSKGAAWPPQAAATRTEAQGAGVEGGGMEGGEAGMEGGEAGLAAWCMGLPPYACKNSDVWSLGVILFALLANQLPFDGDEESDEACAALRAKVRLLL